MTKTKAKTRKLTARQKAFIQEYPIDLNGTQAAIRAGYSKKTANRQATENLSKPVIQAAIQEALDKWAKRTEITIDRTLTEIARLAFSDIREYIDIGADGCVQVKPFEDMPKGASRAIQYIKEKKRILASGKGGGEETILESTLELKLWDKGKALDQLGKHLGFLFNNPEPEPEPEPIIINLVNPNGTKAD